MGGAAARPAARQPAGRAARGAAATGAARSPPAPTWPRRGRPRATMRPPPAQAFAPREEEDKPHVVLVEAGTGVGKTLGYVAPASLWAEKNGAPVWIIDLHPQPAAPDRQRTRPAASRFGREAPPRRDPQGPRELSLPAELPGSGDAHRPGAGERGRPRPAGALGAGQPRRRHDRRRPAGLAARPGGPQPRHSGWPTGAASASTRPASTTGSASSNARSAARARPTSSSPTMRW